MEIQYSLTQKDGRSYISIKFELNSTWNKRMQQVSGSRWCSSLKCWLIPDTPSNRKKCGLLPSFLDVKETERQEIREKLVASYNKLLLKGYSFNTNRNYCLHLKEYFSLVSRKYSIDEVTPDIIERYLLWRLKKKNCGGSDMNSHINAIKFYYEHVLGKERMLFDLPRPKKPSKLPKVLGERELERLFRALPNIKHKAILLTAFSCGLRVSEVVNLKISDIDSERMQVLVECGKGNKDRYVMLSPMLLEVLRAYFKLQACKPSKYLFEGMEPGMPYSTRSAQEVFHAAMRKAGIHKRPTFHSLRHSFATHLLEKGVDVKYIKDLLGHLSIITTERYLHVAREQIVQITSPLDYLFKQPGIDLKNGFAQLPGKISKNVSN